MIYIAIDKAYIEDEVDKLREIADNTLDVTYFNTLNAAIGAYKDILSKGVEIPEGYNWDEVSTYMTDEEKKEYPNGVIIKSKL